MAEEKKKRKRSANWDSLEKQLLRACIKEFIQIIENKNTDTNTNKNNAWIQLTKRFNELNDKNRSLVEVKQQWRTMKLDAKKDTSFYKQLNGTGGGQTPSPGKEANEVHQLIPQQFKGQNILSLVNLAGPSKSEPILIEDPKQLFQTITTPLASITKHGCQTSKNEVRRNRKRTLSHDAPESLAKEHNSVLIECIKQEHDLNIKQMIEFHIWAKEESQLRIEN